MIVVAIEKGDGVYVYGERNQLLFCQMGELVGFTSNSVSIKRGSLIHTYDAHGTQISAISAR